jgi:biopolymer transport protein ExbB/TolQ
MTLDASGLEIVLTAIGMAGALGGFLIRGVYRRIREQEAVFEKSRKDLAQQIAAEQATLVQRLDSQERRDDERRKELHGLDGRLAVIERWQVATDGKLETMSRDSASGLELLRSIQSLLQASRIENAVAHENHEGRLKTLEHWHARSDQEG